MIEAFLCAVFDGLRMIFGFQEVQRIKNEHPDDACAVMNDRVKGSLKVTRAFGAGFLKQVLKVLRFLAFNYNPLLIWTVLLAPIICA